MELTGRARGGAARAASMTKEQRRESALKAAAAKRELALLPKATHGSADHPLTIGDVQIQCFVLENGMRVLSRSGLQAGIGMSSSGGNKTGEQRLVSVLSAISEKPKCDAELASRIAEIVRRIEEPIKFRLTGGGTALGIEATILADLCDVLLAARSAGLLLPQQAHVASKAELLVRGFARVGIIALIDEATGYQRDRARDALAKILEDFVAKELQPYVQKFPPEFYEQMFRLRGLPFDATSVRRPQYFGVLTNDIVYRRLAPGVWKELKSKVKKNASGRPTQQMHRYLTPDIGDPRLRELITKVTTIMELSNGWDDFKAKLDRLVPKHPQTLDLPFEIENDDGKGI